MSREQQLDLARARRVEHHQQTRVSWLLPADLSPLEPTVALEQVAIEITSAVAQQEPDAGLAPACRLGMLEDRDHPAPLRRPDGADHRPGPERDHAVRPGRHAGSAG